MKTYRERLMADLQLAGYSERTRECYIREVRRLIEFCGWISPAKVTAEQIRDGMLLLKNDCNFSSHSRRE